MGALSDLRVLDLSQVLSGPYCTMLLADMGADVVKVEPPGGDLVRPVGPHLADDDAYGGYFQSVNRGKRSVELDLTDPGDRSDFRWLVERADVLLESYRAGTMERFGLGYESLREQNPGLVYAAIRGFGDPRTGESDRQGQPTFDILAQALGGVMAVTGQPDGPPTKVGPAVGDLFPATLACVGILAALHHRERTGIGQFVDVGLYDAMVSFNERSIYQQTYTGHPPNRHGNAHPSLFPYDGYETTDGYVVVAAFSEGHWRALCQAMERPDLATQYTDYTRRLRHRETLGEIVSTWFAERSTEGVLERLHGRVPVAPVQNTDDVVDDPHVRNRELLIPVEQPGSDRTVEIAGCPIGMTDTPPAPGGRAPLLDEHRSEILDARASDDW